MWIEYYDTSVNTQNSATINAETRLKKNGRYCPKLCFEFINTVSAFNITLLEYDVLEQALWMANTIKHEIMSRIARQDLYFNLNGYIADVLKEQEERTK
jgi:hypothetical protein